MTLTEFWKLPRPFWQGAGEGAGGGAGGAGAGGEGAGGEGAGGEGGGGAGAGGGEGAGGGAGGGEGEGGGEGAGEGAGGGKPWWEADTILNDERDWLAKKGMTTEDKDELLLKAFRGWRASEQKLGKPADSLIAKPGEGEDVKDWVKANRELFGLPEKADGYEIKRPELPKGVEYDEALEAQVREIAFEEGVPPGAVQRLVEAYAKHVGGTVQGVQDELNQATEAMMEDLRKDWGDELPAKLQIARQGMSAIAEAAGLDNAALQNLTAALKEATGDAAIIRMGAAIGEMLGEDGIKGLGKGGTALGTTPAEARQQLARLRGPDGDYGKAMAAGDVAAMNRLRPEIERLTKIASAAG